MLQMTELTNHQNELRVARLLEVKSLGRRADYFVLELNDATGRPLANAAIQRDGALIGVEDLRTAIDVQRPVDLGSMTKRMRKYGTATARSIRYVFAPNYAEPGSSPFRPLAAIETPNGTLYVNSKGEEFTDEGGPLAETVRTEAASPVPVGEGTMRLRKIVE
jgi:hypothetical protein